MVTDMCHYCGCRNIPLLIDFIAEHQLVGELGAEAVTALDDGDVDQARAILDRMAQELRAHWQGEENGLFDVMRRSDEYADYIADLVWEHRELDALLSSVDLDHEPDRVRVRAAVAGLDEHIRKEEDGLFPASLTALDGPEWDRSIAAWQEAHPGSTLQTQGS